jgi:hypothetical protein
MDFAKFISYLLHSRTQAHIFHLQTRSFAAHKTLNKYYDGIVDLVDGLVETYQGKYGILEGYSNFSLIETENCEDMVSYFQALLKAIENNRSSFAADSYLQNQIDTVIELITSTLYKLTNLK